MTPAAGIQCELPSKPEDDFIRDPLWSRGRGDVYKRQVIGDLNSRRGQISTQEQRGNATVITAMVPLANMFGYINNLRSMSQGRAQYSMFFDHYSKVPQNVQDEVTKKVAG